MSEIDEKTLEIIPKKAVNKGGRPKKQRKSPSNIRNKRVRRASTTNYDLTATAAALHAAALHLEERIIDAELNLHFDFKNAMLIRIRSMRELARGLSLHRDNPHDNAYRNIDVTEQQLEKETEEKRRQLAKQLNATPRSDVNIKFS